MFTVCPPPPSHPAVLAVGSRSNALEPLNFHCVKEGNTDKRKLFGSLIALLAVALVTVWGGTAFAACHEAGEFTSENIEGEEEGVRLEVLEGYVSPGIITDSMLLSAGKDSHNWILCGKDYSHTR